MKSTVQYNITTHVYITVEHGEDATPIDIRQQALGLWLSQPRSGAVKSVPAVGRRFVGIKPVKD